MLKDPSLMTGVVLFLGRICFSAQTSMVLVMALMASMP